MALVLGGGGILGGAWMAGALQAIHEVTKWDPRTADTIIGTSAGAMIGALLATGVEPAEIEREMEATGSTGSPYRNRVEWHFPRPIMGSPGLALRSLREPWRYGPAGIIAWLPQGVIGTAGLSGVIRRRLPSGWVVKPKTWIVATDYRSGERVVFGQPGAPAADLADAVAASCAIPGFYFPAAIGGGRYVDGGVLSPSNLDLAATTHADVVICLNPMSSASTGGALSAVGRIAQVVRGGPGVRLRREAGIVAMAGKQVELVQPGSRDLAAMGFNYMNPRRRTQVMRTAVETTMEALDSGSLVSTLKSAASWAVVRQRRVGSAAV